MQTGKKKVEFDEPVRTTYVSDISWPTYNTLTIRNIVTDVKYDYHTDNVTNIKLLISRANA